MKKSNRGLVFVLAYIAITAVCVFSVSALAGVKINTTDSLPLGLYIEVAREEIHKGDIVNLVVPDNEVTRTQFRTLSVLEDRPKYYLKMIYGVAGEQVYVDDETVLVGDLQLHMQEYVLSILESGTIPEGYVFVGTPHKYSFDSRYYGLIDTKTITGVYVPLLTFGGPYG